MARKSKEEWKTYKNVFDNFTLRTLEKLRSEHHYDELEGPVGIGKEANTFLASKGEGKVLIKIYRLETCDFNRLYDYIKYDPRFITLKKNRRKVIFAWTQREYRNLMKAREAGLNVPMPIAFKNNVLVMELIGDTKASPLLKNAAPKDPEKFFKELIENMKRFYKADMVHGDLSEFNVINHKEKPVLIDFSQATLLKDTNAKEFVERDVRNVVKYFKKRGVETSEEETMEKITEK